MRRLVLTAIAVLGLLVAPVGAGVTAATAASTDRTLVGTVTGPDGQPVSGITVEASPYDGGLYHETTTDSAGHYTLADVAPGRTVVAARDGYDSRIWKDAYWTGTGSTTRYPSDPPSIPEGPGTTTVDLTLEHQTGIVGRAVDADGNPLQNIGYSVDTYNPATGGWDSPQMGPLLTDADGTFLWGSDAGEKVRFCFYDNWYDTTWRPAVRYADACWQGTTTMADATVITTPDALPTTYTVPMTVAGSSLTRMDTVVEGPADGSTTLTAHPGTWGPAGVQLSYQWQRVTTGDYRDAQPIEGATDATYTPTAADSGATLFVLVTGSLPGHATTSTTGYAGEVGRPWVTTTSPLTITGTPEVGQTLHASYGSITPTAAADYPSYEWYVDGVLQDLPGGSVPDLTLTPEMAGRTITLRLGAYTADYNELHAEAVAGPVT